MRKHIFNAGPCKLPDSTLENVSKAVLEFGNTGQSIMEVSHRSADFQAVYEEAVALFKEVLNIPEGYSVLFLGGGASMQFCMIPFNFLKTKAAYVNTGTWSTAAIKEAKMWGEVEIVLLLRLTDLLIILNSRFLQTWITCTSLQTTRSALRKFSMIRLLRYL